jgi:DNA-binding protein HU-beta/integration host factor subunit alpha
MDNKSFISTLAKRIGRENKDVTVLVEGLSAIIKEHCGNMESIAVPGFGNFVPQKQDETISIDHSTGKRMLLPPEITLSFTASGKLKKQIIK